MVALEALIGGLVAVVFILGIAALWIGFLGIIGAGRFVRCDECGRIALVSASAPPRACLLCRHRRLLHPVTSVHRDRAVHRKERTHGPQEVP